MPNLKITLPALSVMLQMLLPKFLKHTSNNSNPGQSVPLVLTPIIQSSEIKPGNALVLSESPVKLTETNVRSEPKENTMSLNSVVVSLSTIVSGISAIATGVVTVYENGQKLLYILKAAGATKKEIVMSTLQAAADALGEAWDSIKAYFSALIDSIISVYNQAKAVVADVKTVADGGTVTASTSAVVDADAASDTATATA